MRNEQRLHWGAMLLAANLLAACGGSGDSDESAETAAATSMRPSVISGRSVTIITGGGEATKTPRPEEYESHGMADFQALRNQTYAMASIKFLMSALGPKKLLDHLEGFKANAQDPELRTAAEKFIALIHQTYTSTSPVWITGFLQGLQNLAPFNQRNAAGEWEFKIGGNVLSQEQDPERFLLLLSQLFRLDTLPGGSFGIKETQVHQGQERAQQRANDRFQILQPVDVGRIDPEKPGGLSLQKIVDLLHADAQAQVVWNAGDAAPTAVKVLRQLNITDAEQFKRLTLSLHGALPEKYRFDVSDTVTLPAFDQKTGRNIVLTLTSKEVISWNDPLYEVRIKNQKGEWIEHGYHGAPGHDARDVPEVAKVINLAVTNIALAS